MQKTLATLFAISIVSMGCNLKEGSQTPADTDASAQDAENDVSPADAESDVEEDAESDVEEDAESDTEADANEGPAVESFTVDGAVNTTVEIGTEVTVAWESSNTSSCTASGTLPSWSDQGSGLEPTGTFQASTFGLAEGTYDLLLTCTGLDGGVVAADMTRQVIVEIPESGIPCSNRPPPTNPNRATNINADDSSANAFFFADVFGGPFPGSGNSIRLRVRSTSYVAMEFETGNHPGDALGEMQSVPGSTANTGIGPRLWSVSKCPGDFRPFVIDTEMGPGCVQGPTSGHFRFGGTDYRDEETRCALETNTTYFMNFIYTESDPPSTEQEHDQLDVDCSDTYCGANMKAAHVRF